MLSYKKYILSLIEEGWKSDKAAAMSDEEHEKYVDDWHAGKGGADDGVLGHIARQIKSVAHLHKLASHPDGWVAAQTAENPNANHETAQILSAHKGFNKKHVEKAVSNLNNKLIGNEKPGRISANLGRSSGSSSSSASSSKAPFGGKSPEQLKKLLDYHNNVDKILSDEDVEGIKAHLAAHATSSLPKLPAHLEGKSYEQLKKLMHYHKNVDPMLSDKEESAVQAHIDHHEGNESEAAPVSTGKKSVPNQTSTPKSPPPKGVSHEEASPEERDQHGVHRLTHILNDGKKVGAVFTKNKGEKPTVLLGNKSQKHSIRDHDEAVEHAKTLV